MSYTNGLDNSELHFQTKIYTGTGSSNSITLDGSENMQPDFVWIKDRTEANWHNLYDSVRGATKRVFSNTTSAEETQAQGLNAFSTDGYTLGTNVDVNKSGNNYVAWNWKAGGSAPAITYSVKVVSDSGNKYRFDDFGTSAVTLELQEGGTYTFDQSDSSNAGHPLRFSTTSNGTHGGGSEYTTGVTTTGTPGSAGAKTVITLGSGVATLYYYCTQHSGMGGQANTNSLFGSSNFSGGIQSVASANVTSGFSIVRYTGTGSASTIGHGLGTTPSMVWIFATGGGNAHVYHKSLGSTQYLLKASTLGVQTYSPVGIGSLTSSTFSVGTVSGVNGSGSTYWAYVFADTGNKFCKIDNYTGNGSTFGTYVDCGFRPAWVFVKRVDSTSDWLICDNKRDPDNGLFKKLFPNTDQADDNYESFDFYSNGFKIRSSGSGHNASGANMLYMAFAESPFVNSNGVPSNAR